MIRLASAGLLAAAFLMGCAPASAQEPPRTASTSAVSALEHLQVRGKAPMTGYSRAQFGHGWSDPDGNNCDARRDTLERQAVGEPVRAGNHRCVLTATILDPYTGNEVASTRADIDHVVALGNAWGSGAWQASPEQREALANDPLNLIAVTASVNRQKQDSDAASWLPPLRSARCPYVAVQIAVKQKYRLSVTPAEHDAIARVLSACPGQPLPITGDQR